MSQDTTGKERAWPTLIGKGGRPMSPRGKLTKSGGAGTNGGSEDGTSGEGGADQAEDSPRGVSTSPRGPTPTSPRGAGSSSSSSTAPKPKPDLRARALMSHKKMQEQFNPKKSVTCAGGLTAMAGRLTREEMAGRAVVLALDLAESLHGRRPTPAEVCLIADMLRTLRNQRQAHGGYQHDRRTDGALRSGGGSGGEHVEKAKKTKKNKNTDKNDKDTKMDTKEKKDKKKEKKDKKEKKKDKKRKSSKERDAEGERATTSTTTATTAEDGGGGSESGIGSGISSGAGTVPVLGGHLEYTEETKGENEAAVTLATADTLKLKELVHAHLKQALSAAHSSPDRSPRPDDRGKVRVVGDLVAVSCRVLCAVCRVAANAGSPCRARVACRGATNSTPKRTRACGMPTKTHISSSRYDCSRSFFLVVSVVHTPAPLRLTHALFRPRPRASVQHYNDLHALKNAPPQIYIGIFDGHSGKEAAEYCR